MNNKILVAGATGDLGNRIVKALSKRNAHVVAIVRHSSDGAKIAALEKMGVTVIKLDTSNVDGLTGACKDVACIVSALAGLKEIIIDAQGALLDAAIAADVPRFIPSDYSCDFTQLKDGDNRNSDLRKEFHKKLDASQIQSTYIMNGAFANVLAYNIPLYNLKEKTIGYWGNDADFHIDFTTKDDVANFTAAAASDATTPKILRIASFQISPNELVKMATEMKKTEFNLIPMGSLEALNAYNKKEREANPAGENELYPKWQGSQYMHSMFSVQNKQLDNNRYPDITWTTAQEVLSHK